MSGTNKIVIIAVGFSICFYIGWFFPLLWLVWLAVSAVVLLTPTKKSAEVQSSLAATSTTPQQQITYQPAGVEQVSAQTKIEEMIASETNVDIKTGLQRALTVLLSQPSSTTLVYPMQPALQPYTEAYDPPRAESAEDIAKRKHEQELRNINTILYTASFLLVGAAALFIGFNDFSGPMVKFVTILFVALLFYASGLTLHRFSKRLLPAGTAFAGTGLALIPFVGLAFNSFVYDNPSLTWWLTSLVGLFAFVVALYQLRSTLMVYLTLAFVFSLATSSVSVLGAPFLWYFISIIATSSLMMYLSYKIPGSLPLKLKAPLEVNAQIATPVALIGSTLLFSNLSSFEYAMIFGTGALHYLVNALGFSTDKTRYAYWAVARGLTILFATTLTYHFTDSWTAVCWMVFISAILTHVYSIVSYSQEKHELWWLWGSQILLLFSLAGLASTAEYASIVLAALTGVGLHQLYATRRFELSITSAVSSIVLPLVLLRGVIDPPIGFGWIAGGFVLLAFTGLFTRWILGPRAQVLQLVTSMFYAGFLAAGVIVGLFENSSILYGVVLCATSAALYVAALIEREPLVNIASSIIGAFAVPVLFYGLFGSFTWIFAGSSVLLAGIWYGLAIYYRRLNAVEAADHINSIIFSISAVSALVLGGLITMFQSPETIGLGVFIGCLAAGLLAYEAYVRKIAVLYEVAVYLVTFSLQRFVAELYPQADWLVYTHWWAFSIAISTLLYARRTANKAVTTTKLVVAMTVLSVPTALAALINGSDGYRIVFLLEHVILAVAGLAASKKLVLQWGAIGVGLSILWMLRGYTYLLLAVLAIGLIAFAVWRLLRKAS